MGRRGQGKHMKRINAPKHLMLDKLGGIFVRFSLGFSGRGDGRGKKRPGGGGPGRENELGRSDLF